MRIAIAVAGLALLTPVLTAQVPATSANLTVVTSPNCPVVVSAQRWAPGGMALAHNPGHGPERNKLYLHFLATPDKEGIVAATVVLHGTDGGPRAELAAMNSTGSNLTETVHLASGGMSNLRDFEVTPNKVVYVRWVGITEVRYADGKVWHESADGSCHITPDGFRLVAAESK